MRAIDGDALRDKLQNLADDEWNQNTTTSWAEAFSECADMVDDAPTIEPEHRWIPCSERLPEANGRYLVTRGLKACGSLWNRIYIANYSDLMGIKSERIWWQGNVGKSDFKRIDDVIAWMPLPEVYQEGADE